MKIFTYPQIDNIGLWDKIVSRKRHPAKDKLIPLREKVYSRYDFYEKHFNSLDEIQPLPPEEWHDASTSSSGR